MIPSYCMRKPFSGDALLKGTFFLFKALSFYRGAEDQENVVTLLLLSVISP